VFLLDGVARWNIARKEELKESSGPEIRTFDQELASVFDSFHVKVFGKPLLNKDQPSANIDELFGMEYLFRQSNLVFDQKYIDNNLDDGIDIDSGIELDNGLDFEPTIRTSEIPEEVDDEEGIANTSVDSRGIPGWNQVDRLAEALVLQHGISISHQQSNHIVNLYNNLDDFDKKPMSFQPIKIKPATGRFMRKKRMTGHAGIVAMKRSFVSGGNPSLPPSSNRLVEAIFIYLCNKHASSSSTVTSSGKQKNSSTRFGKPSSQNTTI